MEPPPQEAGRTPGMPAAPLPDPPPEVRRPAALARAFGPGAIIASVSIASGETIFAARAGAIFGYRMLWLIPLAALLKGFMIYSAARYAVLAGEHPLRRWCRLPGPRAWPAALLVATCVLLGPTALAGLAKMFGPFLVWVAAGRGAADAHPGTAAAVSFAALLVCALLAWRSSYRLLEAAERILVAILMVFVLAAVVAAAPDWAAVARHSVLPVLPSYPAWLRPEAYPDFVRRAPLVEIATTFSLVGGTLPDYVAYLAFLREKGWGRLGRADAAGRDAPSPRHTIPPPGEAERGRAAAWLRLPRLDTAASFTCVGLFTMAFMILGAAILHRDGKVPAGLGLLEEQAAFLTRIHPALIAVYQVGIFAAFAGTLYGAFEVLLRTVVEGLRELAPRRAWRLRALRPWYYAWCLAAAAPLVLTPFDPVAVYTPWALLAGSFGLGLWCLAMLWTDGRFLPRALRMRRATRLGTLAGGIVMTALGLVSIAAYLGAFGAG